MKPILLYLHSHRAHPIIPTLFFLLGSTHLYLPDTHTHNRISSPPPEATDYKLPTRITHLGQAWPDPHGQQSKQATGSTKGAPLGMMRPSGSLMSSVQRRETRVTGGNWRRLSLMHMVVKGSWVRSSLGNVEQWVTRGQAVMPPLP